MVLARKKLFQAQPAAVGLGSSTTDSKNYMVMARMPRRVICCNTWREHAQSHSRAAREWHITVAPECG